MDAVELSDVTKTFGRHVAVEGLSLKVPERSVYGFIGPNGSGKTTTMRLIMNILYPDSGAIRVFGEELAGNCPDHIGYMPEERGLYKTMRVREVLEFYGDLKDGANVRQEAARWLERFGLADWAKKKVEALSKGMRQKVQFIATVVARPRLLILDEPFTGLDPVNADAIREAMLELRNEGTTIILSTHDMAVAERMCDFIFMIFKGRKVLDGTLASIQDRYGSDTIRVRADGGDVRFSEIDGVARVTDFGNVKELQMTGTRAPQDIVADVMARARVWGFELTKPSLRDIFVRIAGPGAGEA
jgi:ABC-2 type transport system ATP-binding protein